jgi:predicted nucleotidyltransferase
VDLAHPIRTLVTSLDGPVLEVLARTTRPLTGREVHRLAAAGSENGVRAVLHRLAEQGLVRADERSNAVFYALNRDHLAAPAVDVLVNLWSTFVGRLYGAFDGWEVPPIHASLFGSAARRDGTTASDVDILLVRPAKPADSHRWVTQTERLAESVHTWTGNHCQLYEVTRRAIAEHVHAREPIIEAWRRDAVTIYGPSIADLLKRLA